MLSFRYKLCFVFILGSLSLQVPASQENVIVAGSARSGNSKHIDEDVLSLVNNQVAESLKRLLPQMLTESLQRTRA